MKLRNVFLLLMAAALSACVNLGLDGDGDARSTVFYVLDDAGREAVPLTPSPRTLLMMDTVAGAFYDTDGMAFSAQPGTRNYYKYARWSERAGKRYTDLLLLRLERERIFASVALSGGNLRGDWLLTTEILDFHHAAEQQPGVVKMAMRAEVIDLEARRLVARKVFTQSVPVSSFNAAGAHEAFNQATTRSLNDMADWLKELAGKP